MELKKLEYLETIYRLRSFTKAAEELYISQPSLSNAIQKLEGELGVILINRSEKPLVFTQEGERFMWHAYRILNMVKDAVNDMKEMAEARERLLTVVWPSCTANDSILPRIYTEFHELYPQYQIALIDDTIQNTMIRLLSEDVELAFVHIPDGLNLDAFEFIPILCCEVCAMLSKAHPLSRYEKIPWNRLGSERIYTFQPGSLIRQKLEEGFRKASAFPEIVNVNQMEVAKRLVKQGGGITFSTIDDIEKTMEEDGLLLVPMEEPISFVKGFLMKRGCRHSPAVRGMVSYVQNTIQELRFNANRKDKKA